MVELVILISGGGSNMEAIIRAAQTEDWPGTLGARVAGVISNRPDAAGLQIARRMAIPTDVVDHRAWPDRSLYDKRLAECVEAHLTPGADSLVVLAGFMRLLGADFVGRYEGRLINIHPSLLPAFPGLHTHRRALQAGVRLTGATVHRVDAGLDSGPILDQAVVPVLPGDTEATLAARVLSQEHLLYPRAIRALLASGHR
jgi:phosphoribosylglycinamide formyltransferase-1